MPCFFCFKDLPCLGRTLRKMGAALQRVKADIKDFDPGGLPCLEGGGPWVAVGKHLCGAATDFTLRCVTRCKTVAKVHGEAQLTECYQFCCDNCAGIPLGFAACTTCRPPSFVAINLHACMHAAMPLKRQNLKWFASANSEWKPCLWHAWEHGSGRANEAWRHCGRRAHMSAKWRLRC